MHKSPPDHPTLSSPRSGLARHVASATALAAALLTATLALAQDDLPEGARLALQGFASMDEDGSGTVSEAEMAAYEELVFVSMDSDGSGGVDEHEFTSWGWGQENLAAEGGQTQAYDTARRIVVDLLDRSNDGAISPEEQREGMAAFFAYADRDGDGALTPEEYLGDFITSVALRTALTADAQ